MRTIALILALTAASLAVHAAPRSHAAKLTFQRNHPCPSTGKPRGACPGYVIDHIKPLCAGGADAPGNMQWQTVAAAKIKDREEVRECRALKK